MFVWAAWVDAQPFRAKESRMAERRICADREKPGLNRREIHAIIAGEI